MIFSKLLFVILPVLISGFWGGVIITVISSIKDNFKK